MPVVHMAEVELARDVHAAHRPVAIVKAAAHRGRMLSACSALAEARGKGPILDEGFMKDVEEGIAQRSQPWKPPHWE